MKYEGNIMYSRITMESTIQGKDLFKRQLKLLARFYIFVFSCACYSSAFFSNLRNFTRFRVISRFS